LSIRLAKARLSQASPIFGEVIDSIFQT